MGAKGCGWLVLATVFIIVFIILAVILGRQNNNWCDLSKNAGKCKYNEYTKLCYCIDTFTAETSINQSKDLGLYERSAQQCKSVKGSLAVADDNDLLVWLAKQMYKMGVDNALVSLHKMASKWFWMEDGVSRQAVDLVWKPEFAQDPKHSIAMISVETFKKIDDDYEYEYGQQYLNYDHYLEIDQKYQWYGFRTSDDTFPVDNYYICEYDSGSDLEIDGPETNNQEVETIRQNNRCYCSSSEKIELSTAGDSETFQSPGYPQNYCSDSNCRWIVVIPDGYAIKLDWLVFSTEQNMDMVFVYDGQTDDSPLLVTCTGLMCTNQLSSGNVMQIHFSSDHITTEMGFRARVTGIEADPCFCSESASLSLANLHDSYTLTSPQYPQPYCMLHHCGWTISAPSDLGLQITWINFDTETDKDYVSLYDGDVLLKQCSGASCLNIETQCGGVPCLNILPIISTTKKIHVQFVSDAIASDNMGFQATISVVQNYCEKHESRIDGGLLSYSSIRADGRAMVGSTATLTCGENSKIHGTADKTNDTVECISPNWHEEFETCIPACNIDWKEISDYTNITYCEPNAEHKLYTLSSSGQSLLIQQYDFVWQAALNSQENLTCIDGLWMPRATPSVHCSANIDPKILIIGGENSQYESDRTMELYYPNKPWLNRVLETSIFEERRHFASTLMVDGRVMSMGGERGIEFLKSCEIYNPKTDTIDICPDLSIARADLVAATLDKTVCICGGATLISQMNVEYLRSCECLKGDTWQEIAPMNTKRANLALVAVNGFLLAIAGYNDEDEYMRSVEKYNPEEQQWTFVASMNSRWGYHGAAVFDGNVVVCGGRLSLFGETASKNTQFCEHYDIERNTWHYFTFMKEKRGRSINLVSTGDSLVALGSNDTPDSVEAFDPESNEWSLIEKTKPRYNYRAVLIP